MKKTLIFSLLVAASVSLATPTLAQFYIGAGPGGVGVGVGPGYYDGGYRRGYYDAGPRYRGYGYDRGYARCRVRIIETPYGIRRVRRCW